MPVGRVFARQESGQTVVLVALMFTMLMGFAALGIDVGRFYSERRYIQDAVDAAALACAFKYAQTGSITQAWAAADDLLQDRNLLNNPLGITLTYPAQGLEVYDNGIVLPVNLNSGILPVNTNGIGCRVAITVEVPTFLIKILSPSLNTIGMTTRAYAKTKAGFLPSVVQRWANPPGPGNGNTNQFIDHVMAGPPTPADPGTSGQDWNCTVTNPAGCTPASVANPGREFVLFGQSAKASNDSSFRGYIALDIRDFTATDGNGDPIHEQTSPGIAYNLVPATATVNTLKALESAWILEGYPGPDICAVSPGSFLPCAQLAVLNGSNSGIFVEDYEDRFDVGDKLLLQLYDGTVKTVPDFSMSVGTVNLLATGTTNATVMLTMSPQFALSSAQITTSFIPDNGTMTTDGGGTSTNPFLSGCGVVQGTPPADFQANPTPSGLSTYTQTWTITTDNCDKGIFQAWVRGESSAPYESRIHEALVNVNVAGQARDFSIQSSDTYAAINGPGPQADYVIRTTTAAGGSTKWTGNNLLTLSWAKCPTYDDPFLGPLALVCGIDGNFAQTVVTNVDPGEDHTFNVQTTGALTGKIYKGWVRETGLDDVTNKRVTHLLEVTLEVGVIAGGATQYADVLGYTVFEVTQVNSNEVWGRAITGAYSDPNDPALAIGRKIGLVPWETP